MTTNRLPKGSSSFRGWLLAVLWGVPPAIVYLPGRLVWHLGCAIALFAIAGLRVVQRGRKSSGHRFGLSWSLGLWLFAATLSAMWNHDTDQVLITFCSVFLTCLFAYWALDGLQLSSVDVDVGVLGLAFGSAIPLLGGCFAFGEEWGWSDPRNLWIAYLDTVRMKGYEDATFGNRGNMAAYITIVVPILFVTLIERKKGTFLRAACAVVLVLALLNLLIIEVRAAYISIALALAFIWLKNWRSWRTLVFAAVVALAFKALFSYESDYIVQFGERLRAAVTSDAAADSSVSDRLDAMKEGIALGLQHPVFGLGPGSGLTRHSQTSAHQIIVQQFMELGIAGAVAVIWYSIALFVCVSYTVRGKGDQQNSIRFALMLGPLCYLTYGLLANAIVNSSYINIWGLLVVTMLAVTPRFPRRASIRKRVPSQTVTCRSAADIALE